VETSPAADPVGGGIGAARDAPGPVPLAIWSSSVSGAAGRVGQGGCATLGVDAAGVGEVSGNDDQPPAGRTHRVERRWRWAGSYLPQLDRATARLRGDLHAIEHLPGSGAGALWPAAISPSGWLVSPPARAAERALVVRSAMINTGRDQPSWRDGGHLH
jgi:hypothetical protein